VNVLKDSSIKKLFEINQTWLQCIYCGRKYDLLDEREFRCPECGDLFEINHNFSFLLDSIKSLKDIFQKRTKSFSVDSSSWEKSGVWRYHELIMPFFPKDKIVTLEEGNVPIIRAGSNLRKWIGGHEIDLWLILEGMTPTGSFKDFGGTVMISVAKAAGIGAIICASTGDTSAMSAAYAAAAGMKCAVILPEGKVTPVQLAQPLVYGAKVITLPGDFDDCMRVVQELVKDYGAYPSNSLNPSRIEGHQATVFQIAQFFDWEMPQWIAVPVGNGSNCSSVGKGIRLLNRLGFTQSAKDSSRILGCQSRAANPLAKSWDVSFINEPDSSLRKWQNNYRPVKVGETTATAARIGDPVSRDKVMREIILSRGAMATAEESDLNDAVAACGKDGIFICPQTGIALTGVRNALKKDWIQGGDRVVVVSTATGLKFTQAAAGHLEHEIIDAGSCSTKKVADILDL